MKSLSKIPFVILGFTALSVLAASVHLKPPHRNPTFADGGLFLSSAGSLAGLGNGDVVVSLSALGRPVASCTNPAGANQPPGQNPAPVAVTGTQIIPEDEIKNGTVSFAVQTTSPVTPIVGAPDCPNPQWTEAITDMVFTNASLTVEQPAGVVVLQVECTLVPTNDGGVPTGSVSCVVTK